ncbi:type II toxin-antitoxin system VapC family toxin [Pedobacter sp. MR2016-19]|jgi:predicted nucleic acid-binding protein|uniref:type II toxin-antitoxin system VapC family toxin n=1 Tax=Pedobacter sp. MR2016-19 TaxID=2780089 RepID=UPI001874066B|nr:type II toxin-antitoxin system VapC family toxin [Pedobacter sp. MR2016-19]MBE5321297.1 type II toxin-antitoxin system VapC family toxin [Pedobacter sp. MR2016-19]
MAERYLIDTSAAIKYLNGTFSPKGLKYMDDIVDVESVMSFISEIELQVWKPTNPDDIIVYQKFVSISIILGLQDGIIAETIRVRKTHNLKLPDALIAATCLVNNLTLIADNDKDFAKVTSLKCVNPSTL